MREQSDWAKGLFRFGPISTVAKWQRMLLSPRGTYAGSDAAKQALYHLLLNKGAVAEINGFVDALRTEAATVRVAGVKVFSGHTALFPSVYEDIATGAKVVGKEGHGATFRGFDQKVIDAVGRGNFWRVIDAASSTWYRGVVDAARAGGKRGELGRFLHASRTRS